MKKYLSIVLLISVVFGSLTLDSCKKGPNDPFISLRSRKARMVGDWIISKYSKEYTQIFIGGEQFTYKIAQDGEGVAETLGYTNYPGKDTTWTWDGKIIQDRSMNFDRDGKVTYKWHYYIDEFNPDLDENATMLYDSTISYERIYYNTGTWNFIAGVDDFKNKERVSVMWEYVDFEEIYNLKIVKYDPNDDELLPVETNSTTRKQSRSYYDSGEYTDVWILDKLKDKELMMYRIFDQNSKVNEGTSATVNTTTDGREQYDLEQE